MGFGVLLASDDKLLGDDLISCLVEVRVEQSLNQPTRWAVRFLDDISVKTGQPTIANAPQLQPGKMLTIAVPDGNGVTVLVRGPIEEIDCNVTLGGPGSWVQYGGRDRRGFLDRVVETKVWESAASKAVKTILSHHGFKTAVEPTKETYSTKRTTLNQRASDLQFVTACARRNNKCFWITYEGRTTGNRLRVEETAHVESSPPRGQDAEVGAPFDLQQLPLSQEGVVLKLNVPASDCQTVTAFNINVDLEATNTFKVNAQSWSGKKQPRAGTDPQADLNDGGEGALAFSQGERNVRPVGAGDASELGPLGEAIVTEAGWFVKATLSTSAHMAGGVIQAHDIVPLVGVSQAHDGKFQVSSVTHVINAADHMMDVAIRRNSVNKPTRLATNLQMTGVA